MLLWNGGAELQGAQLADGRRCGVSILVVVERGGGRRRKCVPSAGRGQVSILVVVERGGGRRPCYSNSVQMRFQSLLLWSEGGRTTPAVRAGVADPAVSILVVVERGGGRNSPVTPYGLALVSILVVVERGGRGYGQHFFYLANWFQSLLLWNGGRTDPPRPQAGCGGGFQSLLLWNGGADLAPRSSAFRILGFNPCCCGTGGGRSSRSAGPQRCDRVSILVVVERGGRTGRPALQANGRSSVFQSLLLWNGGADQARMQSGTAPLLRFNPCCCGTGGRTRVDRAGHDRRLEFNPCCCGTGGADRTPLATRFATRAYGGNTPCANGWPIQARGAAKSSLRTRVASSYIS